MTEVIIRGNIVGLTSSVITLESTLKKYKPFIVYNNCNESYIVLQYWHISANFLHLFAVVKESIF